MKNKIKIMLIILLFMLPFNVEALAGSTELNCSKTSVTPGSTVTCTIKGTSDEEVSSLSSKIGVSSNLTLGDVTVDSIWEGTDEANLDLYTDKNKTGTFAIATFNIKVSSDVINGSNEQITIGSTKFYDGNYDGFDVADTTQSIKILSTVNTLSSLTLSNGILSPSFNSSTTNYSATVDATNVTIGATVSDSKSSISGSTGVISLNYGVNTFKINVTSESGSTKTYTLTITRPDDRDKDNTLSSLNLNDEDIMLSDEQNEYSYEVENDVIQINIEATLNSSKATFVEGYAPRIVELSEGSNVIELKVKAENETVRTYILNIKRKGVIVEDNETGSGNDANNENDNKNDNFQIEGNGPSTGSLEFYIVLVIVIISIVLGVYFYSQYQKKQVKNSDEQE